MVDYAEKPCRKL